MAYLDSEMQSDLEAGWVWALEHDLAGVRRFGPPNWMVKDRMRPGEDFLAAAQRLRKEYGLDCGQSTVDKKATVDKTADNLCVCGQPRAPQRLKCWACIKRASRG